MLTDPVTPPRAAFPPELRTERLLLRPWRPDDAVALEPILVSNYGHLGPWIPAQVADPAPVDALRERLARFAAEFQADIKWRLGIFSIEDGTLLGEVDLFARNAVERVPYSESDRAEVGYWIRSDLTGKGYVTEAVLAVIAAAARMSRFSTVEIRCDAANHASNAIPRRLGFTLAAVEPRTNLKASQVWTSDLSRFR